MMQKTQLVKLYNSGLSVQDISQKLGVPYTKVRYWFEKYDIHRRSRSAATYAKRNPNGDPFKIKRRLTRREIELKGFGLGLYWGEGTKSDNRSVRLGNSEPRLIKKFIEFLVVICGVEPEKLKFSLQTFNDIDPQEAERFWVKELGVKSSQFSKTTVSTVRGEGTYRNKSEHGVLTVYVHNKKLRDALEHMPR